MENKYVKPNPKEEPKKEEPKKKEPQVARRKWATRTMGRNATLGRQGVAKGLKKSEKKRALRQIRTLERENQARLSVNVNKQREKMKQRKIFRENCYLEIINTERQFYQDLRLLQEFYRATMDKKRLVKPIHLASIFSNIKEIMELSGALYNALKEEGQRSEVFASAFTKYAPYFEMYSIYCSTYVVFERYCSSAKRESFNHSTLPCFNYVTRHRLLITQENHSKKSTLKYTIDHDVNSNTDARTQVRKRNGHFETM